jgi:hypothetical protein
VETAAPRITLLAISTSALDAAHTSSQFIVRVGNDLLDKPNIQGFQVAELEVAFKELG